jgi:hypothetical protein
MIAGQPDNALDIIGAVVAGIFEYGDIPTVRQAPEDAPREWRPAEW